MIKTLTKKFSVSAGGDILRSSGMVDAIGLEFGESMKDLLLAEEPIMIDVVLLFDTATKIQFRSTFGVVSNNHDLIGEKAGIYPRNEISQIISSGATAGTILLTVE